MSARYSNTCSRGLEMVVEAVNGSTRRIVWGGLVENRLRRCAPVGDPHRVPELRPVHDVRGVGTLGRERAAQFTQERAAAERVHPLPDQRRPPAMGAALASG